MVVVGGLGWWRVVGQPPLTEAPPVHPRHMPCCLAGRPLAPPVVKLARAAAGSCTGWPSAVWEACWLETRACLRRA